MCFSFCYKEEDKSYLFVNRTQLWDFVLPFNLLGEVLYATELSLFMITEEGPELRAKSLI